MKISILGGAGLMGAGIVRDLVSDLSILAFKSLCVCDVSVEQIERLGHQRDRATAQGGLVRHAGCSRSGPLARSRPSRWGWSAQVISQAFLPARFATNIA